MSGNANEQFAVKFKLGRDGVEKKFNANKQRKYVTTELRIHPTLQKVLHRTNLFVALLYSFKGKVERFLVAIIHGRKSLN